MKKPLRVLSHLATGVVGFALGIYLLPILTAPPSPSQGEVTARGKSVRFTGQFVRDLKDSDALHWGEGTISIAVDAVLFEGELAPGPAYKLYLSPQFVETEADFLRLKAQMVRVGDVQTFTNFIVPLPASIDPTQYNTVIIWCEAFSQFITAAQYR